jgi:hypothetical protein
LLIIRKAMPPQHVHDFPLPASLLEVFTAGASMGFGLGQQFFQGMLTRHQDRTAEQIKLQLGRADPGFALRPLPDIETFHLTMHFVDLLPQPRNPQIGFLQSQLLLAFQALPQP